MGIRLSDLRADVRTIDVDFEGHVIEVSYEPSKYTAHVEDRLQQANESGRPTVGMVRVLAGMLTGWEILDDDGDVLPIEEDVIGRQVPGQVIDAIANAIIEDMQGGDQKKRSGSFDDS